ncbi:Zn-ribbon domain-containing OB-fold protein [Amycolatopsis magusensis]|uniref:Zn-ribbon domain-containing OB-fold protein n=1 Tax=Amycolatopsis magusensis TaxID=882444 RepID=UPI0037A50469
MRAAAHPGLYDPEAEHPTLTGTRCARCERVYFPPLAIGCEACGALEEQLRPCPVAARGRIHAFARVHRETPFTIAEIQLDDGPLIRALLDVPDPRIGDLVHAVWSADDGEVEPVFRA